MDSGQRDGELADQRRVADQLHGETIFWMEQQSQIAAQAEQLNLAFWWTMEQYRAHGDLAQLKGSDDRRRGSLAVVGIAHLYLLVAKIFDLDSPQGFLGDETNLPRNGVE